MTNKFRWLELSPEEFYDVRDAHSVVYMPYGFAESHGHYNPVGVDWFVGKLVCEGAASEYGGIVAPEFAWHVSEEPRFDWEMDICKIGENVTNAIPCDLFLQNVFYHLRSFDARGFKAAILYSGHNVSMDHDVNLMIDFYKRSTGSPIVANFSESGGIYAAPHDWMKGDSHAGAGESSIVWFGRPDLAHPECLGQPPKYPERGGGNPPEFGPYCAPYNYGNSTDRTLPSAELGKRILEYRVKVMGEYGNKLLAQYDDSKPRPKAPSFNRAAGLWAEFSHVTRQYWECLLTGEEYTTRTYGKRPFPGWETLGMFRSDKTC